MAAMANTGKPPCLYGSRKRSISYDLATLAKNAYAVPDKTIDCGQHSYKLF